MVILRQHYRTSARKLKVGHESICGETQQKIKEHDLNRTYVDRRKRLRTDACEWAYHTLAAHHSLL